MRRFTRLDDSLARCPRTLHDSHHSRPVNGSKKMWAMIRVKFYPPPPAADGVRGKLEATFLPSDGAKGKSEAFTPSVLRVEGSILRTSLRGDALEGKTEGLKGKFQPTFLREEGTLLSKEGTILVGEGLSHLEVGAFLPKVQLPHPEGGTLLWNQASFLEFHPSLLPQECRPLPVDGLRSSVLARFEFL